MNNASIDHAAELQRLLPHRAPMLLLDEVSDYSADHACARIHLDEQSAFHDATQK